MDDEQHINQQAIARIKRGDLSGLEMLVRKHQVKAVYAAYLVLQDRQLAEDVVQNAFLRVVERIAQYDDSRSFEFWFFRVVVNAALDSARQDHRWVSLDANAEANVEDIEGMQVEWLINTQPCPQDLVETSELRNAVRLALKKLNADQRAAIVLRYFLDMSEAEMSAAINRPTSTIKWRLHEAKRHLKEILRPIFQPSLDEIKDEE